MQFLSFVVDVLENANSSLVSTFLYYVQYRHIKIDRNGLVENAELRLGSLVVRHFKFEARNKI